MCHTHSWPQHQHSDSVKIMIPSHSWMQTLPLVGQNFGLKSMQLLAHIHKTVPRSGLLVQLLGIKFILLPRTFIHLDMLVIVIFASFAFLHLGKFKVLRFVKGAFQNNFLQFSTRMWLFFNSPHTSGLIWINWSLYERGTVLEPKVGF